MKRLLLLISISVISGCSQTLDEQKQSIKEREYELIHSVEPGTIDYIYESIGITIDKTNVALQILEENKDALSKCFGEKVYSDIVDDYKKKVDFLEDERPYYITTLFLGDSQASDMPFGYNNYRSEIQGMAGQISMATVKCLSNLSSENSNRISDNSTSTSTSAQNILSPPESSAQNLSPDQVFEEAAKQAEKEYDAKWQAIKSDPAKFLSDCKSQDMNAAVELGEEELEKAAKQAETNCNIQLTDLKNCMDKPDANAQNCYDNVFNSGD